MISIFIFWMTKIMTVRFCFTDTSGVINVTDWQLHSHLGQRQTNIWQIRICRGQRNLCSRLRGKLQQQRGMRCFTGLTAAKVCFLALASLKTSQDSCSLHKIRFTIHLLAKAALATESVVSCLTVYEQRKDWVLCPPPLLSENHCASPLSHETWLFPNFCFL